MKKIYGLIGYPVKHSLSPKMHNAAFKNLNINAEYRLFELKPEELEGFLLNNIKVKDIMRKEVITVDEDTSLSEVARIMLTQKIRRVPVLNKEGKVVGIVARQDVVKALTKE